MEKSLNITVGNCQVKNPQYPSSSAKNVERFEKLMFMSVNYPKRPAVVSILRSRNQSRLLLKPVLNPGSRQITDSRHPYGEEESSDIIS